MTQTNSFGRISTRKVFYDHGAVIAQVVERRLGKAEVTGSIPVISLLKKDPGKPGFFHYIKTTGDRSEKTR